MSVEAMAVLKSLSGLPVPLQGVALSGVVEGSLLQFTVEQHYCNTEAQAIEAVYTFPLPVQAVLLSLEVTIGGRTLSGVVQRKREAVETYETALEEGNTAILLEKARDGLFTVSLGNLLAGEQAVIRYRYGQLLSFEQGRVRLAIPMTVAPRYGNAGRALLPHQEPGSDITVSYPCTLALQVRGELSAAQVHSPTHRLHSRVEQGVLTLQDSGDLVLDRDLVLLIEGATAGAQSLLARDGEGYVALASVTVPAQAKAQREARAVKLLVDCSGSMSGDGIDQARAALLATLVSLQATDHVSFTRFGSTIEHLTQGLQSLSPSTLRALNEAVRKTDATLGGTEMQAGIEAVLAIPVPEGLVADVLLVTDGEIWEVDALLERLATAGHRLFVIAVGASPNEELARQVAAVTRGACEFVTPNEDMTPAVTRILARMAAPVLRVGSVSWSTEPLWTLGTGDLVFPGDTVHVLAGFRTAPAGQVVVSVTGAAMPWAQSVALTAGVAADSTLARLAAARRLETLPNEAAAELAEQHQLVTRFTSCVVVMARDDAKRAQAMPVLRTVPNMMSAGQGGARVMRSVPRPPALLDLGSPRFSLRERLTPSAYSAPGLVENDWQYEVARELAEQVTNGGALPSTLEELALLGMPEEWVQVLNALVFEGAREIDVVAAWLANLSDDYGQEHFTARLQRRLVAAADQALRSRLMSLSA